MVPFGIRRPSLLIVQIVMKVLEKFSSSCCSGSSLKSYADNWVAENHQRRQRAAVVSSACFCFSRCEGPSEQDGGVPACVREKKKLKQLKPYGRGAPRVLLPLLTHVQDHHSNIHVVTTSEGRQHEHCGVVAALIAGCWTGFKAGEEMEEMDLTRPKVAPGKFIYIPKSHNTDRSNRSDRTSECHHQLSIHDNENHSH